MFACFGLASGTAHAEDGVLTLSIGTEVRRFTAAQPWCADCVSCSHGDALIACAHPVGVVRANDEAAIRITWNVSALTAIRQAIVVAFDMC